MEREPVDDGGGEAGVVEGLTPLRERGVGGDRHRRSLLTLGPPADAGIPRSEHLAEQLGPARVEVDVAELVEAEQVEPAVAGDTRESVRSSAASASSFTSAAAVV